MGQFYAIASLVLLLCRGGRRLRMPGPSYAGLEPLWRRGRWAGGAAAVHIVCWRAAKTVG